MFTVLGEILGTGCFVFKIRLNTLDEFTEFASWFGQTREHFGSDVLRMKLLQRQQGSNVCVRAILSGHRMNPARVWAIF